MRACLLLPHSSGWLMVRYSKDDVNVSSPPTAISFTGRSLRKLRNARHLHSGPLSCRRRRRLKEASLLPLLCVNGENWEGDPPARASLNT